MSAGDDVRLPVRRRGGGRLRRRRLLPTERASRRTSTSRARTTTVGPSARSMSARDAGIIPTGCLPNTNFRDGIIESFAASPTYPGHLYLTYEDWDGTQFDVEVHAVDRRRGSPGRPVRSTTTSNPRAIRPTSSSRRSLPGPGGAVAVAFYDRRRPVRTTRASCPATSGDELLHRRLAPGLQGHGCRRRSRSAATSGSRSSPGIRSSPASTSAAYRQYACAGHTRPVPERQRLHRRLLRPRDLGPGTSTRSSSRRTTPRP